MADKEKSRKKRKFVNRLNDLSNKEWLKFQKSWFIHNPPRRRKDVLRHPAKFPETLVQEFIQFFTKADQSILDPMAGTGSALVAALREGRHSYGIELNPAYADIARQVIAEERQQLGAESGSITAEVITGDARQAADFDLPPIDYIITSPPYWDMLRAKGGETQNKRRSEDALDLTYSDDPNDLGNLSDYRDFLDQLVDVYKGLRRILKPKAYFTLIVKNVKKGGVIYPLAWDLARRLSKIYTLKDEKIWCQDNTPLAPYGMGSAWVSNTVHHYCLQFRNEE